MHCRDCDFEADATDDYLQHGVDTGHVIDATLEEGDG